MTFPPSSDRPTAGIIGELHGLRFDLQDALLRVKRGEIIDLGDIDLRIDTLCKDLKSEPKPMRDQAEPIMVEIITTLEELADSLRDAIDSDPAFGDDDDDGDDDGGYDVEED